MFQHIATLDNVMECMSNIGYEAINLSVQSDAFGRSRESGGESVVTAGTFTYKRNGQQLDFTTQKDESK